MATVAAPTCVITIVLSESSAMAESETTGGAAAVAVVFSVLSKVIKVESTVVPFSLTSTVISDPDACAVVSEARTPVSVFVWGILKVSFDPVLKGVISSLAAITKLTGSVMVSVAVLPELESSAVLPTMLYVVISPLAPTLLPSSLHCIGA